MEECRQAMEALGRSMERMAARGYREKESWLCMKAANSLYFMCLYIRRPQRSWRRRKRRRKPWGEA